MNRDDLRHCLDTSLGPKPTQAGGLTSHLAAFCWPGGCSDRAKVRVLSHRVWSELAVLPLPQCSCPTGHCRLCS